MSTATPKRGFESGIITANDLLEGDVVYLTNDGAWSRAFTDATVFTDIASAQSALESAGQQSDRIVGAYIADVEVRDNEFFPSHFRESFRATGPSNYFHGKQAD